MERKIYKTLLNWKNTKHNECLIVKGARQVGKTYIINEFGKKNYKKFFKLDFFENPEYKEIFNGSLEVNKLLEKFSVVVPDFEIIKGETLIFLDEIQECPKARTALKFLAMKNDIDVIASGSLLGILNKEIPSIPVGYERQITMYSMDFEEFLLALGISKNTFEIIEKFFANKEKVPDIINNKFFEYLSAYMLVGGMPEVVKEYIKSKNHSNVQIIQEKILNDYREDITKYASTTDRMKIRACYDTIPSQLAQENKKFKYSTIEKNATAKKYENCIDWLINSNLVYKINNSRNPQIPLRAYEQTNNFKLYISDIGLLMAMYGMETKKCILNDSLTGPAKGGIFENLILDILIKKGFYPYFFKDEQSTQEIEFIIEKDSTVIPIEVKSKHGRTISLDNFINKYNTNISYKLVHGNIGSTDKKVTIPHYMAIFI